MLQNMLIRSLALLLLSSVCIADDKLAGPSVAKPSQTADCQFEARGGKQQFPDFKLEYKPPDEQYSGRLFRLSQDYPPDPPRIEDDPTLAALLKMPYGEKHVDSYLKAVREYCLTGNVELGEETPNYDDDWQHAETFRRWYHVPWQHYGEKGREGIHGLTREASARPNQLASTQANTHQTHAVALYNAIGGYTIGRVWDNQFEPDPRKARFEVGTVVVKVLFTQAKEDEVPYLHNPLIWQAYVQDPQFPKEPAKRKVQKLRLLQMDVMIRDDRVKSTGGWIFGTYCYNGDLDEDNKSRWLNLVPVGVQWGNDPGFTDWEGNNKFSNPNPTKTKPNPKLRETAINKSKHLPPQHLGWGGRLNGPADYYRSSCMSCHATAQYPGHSVQNPDFDASLGYEPGSKEWMAWFRNLECGTSFNPHQTSNKKAISTDYSLQLQVGIDSFYKWKSKIMEGYFTFRDDTHEPASGIQP